MMTESSRRDKHLSFIGKLKDSPKAVLFLCMFYGQELFFIYRSVVLKGIDQDFL